jgi:hypothetical protein
MAPDTIEVEIPEGPLSEEVIAQIERARAGYAKGDVVSWSSLRDD